MKEGEVYYCIKDRYDGDTIVNVAGEFYKVRMYDFNFDNNTVWMDNECHMSLYFYSIEEKRRSRRDIYGNIKEHRFGFIFSDYFISIRESRRIKLDRLRNVLI